jgi:2-keto-4-pentenoate hydratase/2-oxohepta-3-ene-1,7-dioic acid hydratase in catechol pathway
LRLVSFGDKGREKAGVLVENKVVEIGAIDASLPNTIKALLVGGELEALARGVRAIDLKLEKNGPGTWNLSDVRLGPPITDPSKVICLGLNYADHAREQNKQPPEKPLLFSKAPSTLTGPADVIVIPKQDECVDCEAELAVVIGATTRNIDEENAMSAVAGYMAFNDVSARHIQRSERQWFRGKSFDTFAPCGPALVTVDEIPDPHSLAISSRVNDRYMQQSSTSELIFKIPYVISYVSQSMTLCPGDIIATGTPAGVGVFRDPPVFLKPGELVTIEIEGIGRLENRVVAE